MRLRVRVVGAVFVDEQDGVSQTGPDGVEDGLADCGFDVGHFVQPIAARIIAMPRLAAAP